MLSAYTHGCPYNGSKITSPSFCYSVDSSKLKQVGCFNQEGLVKPKTYQATLTENACSYLLTKITPYIDYNQPLPSRRLIIVSHAK